MKNPSSVIFKGILYLGRTAWLVKWLSVARSPFIVGRTNVVKIQGLQFYGISNKCIHNSRYQILQHI